MHEKLIDRFAEAFVERGEAAADSATRSTPATSPAR